MIPITDAQADYAREIEAALRAKDIRVELDARSESMQKRIRYAQQGKVPYMLIVGAREAERKEIALRSRKGGDQGAMALEGVIQMMEKEIKNKTVS